ncbi:DUF397 domain-containing protein [Actinomadura chibensis]|uniref:DUF397 domain-containing protein n=1 Tax=Actinomadura chibensis TaxID=392828 RepID=A0A5D0NQN5_9ACTN|nr:DUF397 domain-containing protein [Actinomadura chibensis]TYB46448.1 DUF397 domain-containing protein [Actinomadura chibensis]
MAPNTTLWRKSSHSSNNGGNCIELARLGATLAIRDSKNPDGPKLLLSPENLRHLVQTLKNA